MKVLLCIVPFLLLVCGACTERNTRDVSEPVAQVPDLVAKDGGTVTRFFDTTNPFTEATLRATVAVPVVVEAIERFEGVGYELRIEHSFVTEGVTDGREMTMSILTLANTSDETRDAINLICTHEGDRWLIAPLRVTPEGATALTYGPGSASVVLEALEPTVTTGAPAPAPVSFNWKRWGRCIGTRMAGATAGCFISCRLVPLVYLRCMAVCTAAQAVSALVTCTFAEL